MKTPQPPRWALRFLEWYCPPVLAEGILGDLYEEFDNDVELFGLIIARRRFAWNTLRFFRPGIILRNQIQFNNNNMWSNYFKIAGRNLLKRKVYSLINAVGLSVGIAFCMLIFLFIEDEKSFDKFHSNSEYIYRVEEKAYDTWQGEDPENPFYYSAWLQTGLQPVVLEEVSQIRYATRFNSGGEEVVKYNGEVQTLPVTYVDQDFFAMFDFPSVSGDRENYLREMHHVVLPETEASKIFGDEDPLNKTIDISINGENKSFTVSGIIKDAPGNSSLDYGLLIAQPNRPYYERNLGNWQNFNTPLFIQTYPDANLADLHQGFSLIVDKYMAENLERNRKEQNIPEDVTMFEYQLSKFEDIHLNTQISWTRSSDPKYAYILSGIGLLILLIACINYVSLALTSSAGRRVEVGIRKAIGAHRKQLLAQFSVEAVLLALFSLIIAVGLVYLFLPSFNEFTNKQIELNLSSFLLLIGSGILIATGIGLLSGSYPSFYLSGLNPTSVLKRIGTRMKAGFTKPLVVIQYALSGILIISSLIMLRQMEYITSKDLGYDQQQVVVINTNQGYNEGANRFIEQLRQKIEPYPQVELVSGTSTSFNRGWSRNGYRIDGENKSAYVYQVDHNYVPALDIELLEGRNFLPADSNAIIVNEALVEDMGWENPLEEFLNWREDSLGRGYQVIGVAKNYHFMSLEQKIEPMFLTLSSKTTGYLTTALVRLAPGNLPESMQLLEKSWKELAPDKPFDYAFLDEDVERQYAQYQKWTSIMTLATAFAILISCLGLFGLAGINAVNRTKEIGIRKVMGAATWNIFVLMNRQFIILALISFTLAAPFSWWLMTRWLSDFTYAIDISWDIFILSILIGIGVALITVSYHSIRATLINPADTLKYE